MSEKTGQQKKVKATERLAALESKIEELLEAKDISNATARRVGEMELIVYNLSRENEIMKEALSLLNEKQTAIVSLNNEGKSLSDDNINEKIVSMKELALKNVVDARLESGDIISTDSIGENSLVISRELTEEGKVENPRLQFIVGRLVPELKGKFVGLKAGDLVKGEEGKLDIEIMEIYNFVEKELGQENEKPSDDSVSSEKSEEASEETKE